MVTLTRNELAWIIGELDKSTAINQNAIDLQPALSGGEKRLLQLRAILQACQVGFKLLLLMDISA